MKITFYRSSLCPRCHAARKTLFALKEGIKDLEIEEVDVFLHPLQSWKEGVRLISGSQKKERNIMWIFTWQR